MEGNAFNKNIMNHIFTASYVGILNEAGSGGVVALDRRDPEIGSEIFVKRDHFNGAPFGMKVVVEYTYEQNGRHFGKVVEVLGNPENPAVATLGIIRRYGLAAKFPDAVLREASQAPKDLTSLEIEEELSRGRADHRAQQAVTIDGLDAKDLDDAIYAEKVGDNYRLWVHIADVSYYVRFGSEMDKEAFKRGNSIYLPDLVLPMLPPQISNGIASLHPGVDRLVMTCWLEINDKGAVLRGEVYPGIINSSARLSYEEVEPVLKGEAELQEDRPAGIKEMLLLMQDLANALREQRERRGALDFEFPETKIDVDGEGKPINVRKAEIGSSNRIIEDFMLAANEFVARIMTKHQLPAIYRVHDLPDAEKLQQFQQLSRQLGLGYTVSQEPKPGDIAFILKDLKGKTYEPTMSQVLLRAMAKAEYSATNDGHFALASTDYLHFTAPIRRYADLVTHRALKLSRNYRTAKKEKNRLTETAKHVSYTERIAVAAERDSVTYMTALYLSEHIGAEYEAIISGFSQAAFYVQLENTAEGAVLYRTLPDYYTYLEDELAARNEDTGEVLRLGDKVRVKLTKVDINLLQIDFELIRHDSGTGVGSPKRDSKAKRGGKGGRRARPAYQAKGSRVLSGKSRAGRGSQSRTGRGSGSSTSGGRGSGGGVSKRSSGSSTSGGRSSGSSVSKRSSGNSVSKRSSGSRSKRSAASNRSRRQRRK